MQLNATSVICRSIPTSQDVPVYHNEATFFTISSFPLFLLFAMFYLHLFVLHSYDSVCLLLLLHSLISTFFVRHIDYLQSWFRQLEKNIQDQTRNRSKSNIFGKCVLPIPIMMCTADSNNSLQSANDNCKIRIYSFR